MYGAAFAAKRYRESQDTFASPNDILMRLIRGAIGFVESASAAVAARDIENKSRSINRAVAIVDELMHPLGTATDEPSKNVLRLYRFVREKLIESSVRIDDKALQDARKILVEIEGIFSALIAKG